MITFINFDVGSGIRYVGDTFLDFTKEVHDNVSVISNQNPSSLIHKELMEHKPSIIILNEHYDRALEAIYFYKTSFPETFVIFINHSSQLSAEGSDKDRYIAVREAEKIIDVKIGLNGGGNDEVIDFGYMPVDPTEYCIKTPWHDRKKKFIILGNINSQKISEKFVEKNEIYMDCYGQNNGCYEKFNNSIGLNFISQLDQSKVSDILNEYKYAIFPFGGKEIFSISILQAGLCGTIPIVLNDSGYSWSNWADGIIFEANHVDHFLENIRHINTNSTDMSKLSEHISKIAKEKYSFEEIKNKYQDILVSVLNTK